MNDHREQIGTEDVAGGTRLTVALVKSTGDKTLNLLYKAHAGGGWEVANDVPEDSDRVR